MDFENLKTDVDCILDRHFSEGRSGKPVSFIGIHYNAGNLTVEGCHDVWMNREASAHIQVESSGRSGQLVWDADTAWALGNFDKNQRSINLEHANMADGTITEQALDVGAHIVAAYCRHFGLGRPEWGVNVIPHKAISPTSCPGEIYGSQKNAYIQRAQYWYDVMTGAVAPESEAPATPLPEVLMGYTDLDPDAWYVEAVETCVREGYMGGYGDGRFGPADPITRAQAVMVVSNASREDLTDYLEPFKDVAPAPYYYTALCWAVDRGIVSEQEKFRPDDACTRSELVAMLHNWLGKPSSDTSPVGFSDWQDVPDWASAAMAWAVEAGVVSGSDGRLRPLDACMRAEAAAMLARVGK